MLNSFKYLVLTGLVACLTHTLKAQVRLNLSLLPDQQTYLVSMLPEQSWSAPLNAVGSAQIVLQMDAGRPFLAGQIKSLIPGISWSDNAYIESPAAATEYKFVCFALNEPGTKSISFQAGVETPLFTFINLEPGCVGTVILTDNNNPIVQKVVNNDRYNITQNMTVLGAQGNAVLGAVNNSVDCNVLYTKTENSIVSNLRIYPVPATDMLQIFWELESGQNLIKLLVTDMIGRQIVLETISATPGEQHYNLDVSAFPTGLYTASLINREGERQAFQFTVIRL